MATNTSNYNLGKPEATDDFGSFRQLFNDNMDIIDANLGGGGGGSSHVYMTAEQSVSEWIDGRTVYERTWDLGSDLSCASQAWTDTGLSDINIRFLVNAQLSANDGTVWDNVGINLTTNGANIGIYNTSSSAINIRYITLQYTKFETPPLHLIEYIQSSGTQYIDTGIIPTTDTSFEIILSDVSPLGGERAIFSAGYYASGNYLMSQDTNSSLVWYYPSKVTITADYTSKHKVEIYRGSITLDDVVLTTNTGTTGQSFGNVTIFNVANNRYTAFKLYGFKIYESGVLVFDGVPVKDPNGIACLFDYVSGSFVYNAGSGTFTAGPDL